MSITACVPRRRCDTESDRMTSSVMTPPALRSTCASPSSSPSAANTSSRESMHVTTRAAAVAGRRDAPPAATRRTDVVRDELIDHVAALIHRQSAPVPSAAWCPTARHACSSSRTTRRSRRSSSARCAWRATRCARAPTARPRSPTPTRSPPTWSSSTSGLPKLDGIDVARTLRADGDVPILMLTARDAVDARVAGPRRRRGRLPRQALRAPGAARAAARAAAPPPAARLGVASSSATCR